MTRQIIIMVAICPHDAPKRYMIAAFMIFQRVIVLLWNSWTFDTPTFDSSFRLYYSKAPQFDDGSPDL